MHILIICSVRIHPDACFEVNLLCAWRFTLAPLIFLVVAFASCQFGQSATFFPPLHTVVCSRSHHYLFALLLKILMFPCLGLASDAPTQARASLLHPLPFTGS